MTSTEPTEPEIVQICQNAEAMEIASLQSIRGLFLTIEAVALGVATVLISVKALGSWIVVVTIIGVIITPIWVLQVRQRKRVVDDWNQKICDHTRNMSISGYFDDYHRKYAGLHLRSVKLWLDYITPIAVAVLWVIVCIVGWYSS
jgi:hypothetical protein